MLLLLLRRSKLGNTRGSKGMLLLQIAFVNMEAGEIGSRALAQL
jgi:hypothetical protein